jgi:hypothetical protein
MCGAMVYCIALCVNFCARHAPADIFEARLPPSLPPTMRGASVRHVYMLSIGFQVCLRFFVCL